MKNCLLFFLLFFANAALAQPYFNHIYHRTSDGVNELWGECPLIQPTGDGGYLLSYLPMEEGSDIFLGVPFVIKTDSLLHPQWSRNMDGHFVHSFADSTILYYNRYELLDTPGCVRYILCEKIDLHGRRSWREKICTGSFDFEGSSMVYANGRMRISGYVDLAIPCFLDLDSTGNVIGSDTLSVPDMQDSAVIRQVHTDDSGNYYFVISRYLRRAANIILKMRPDNTIAWSHIINDAHQSVYNYEIRSFAALPDGSVVMGGVLRLPIFGRKAFLVKLNPAGEVVWQKVAGDSTRISGMKTVGNKIIISAAGTGMGDEPIFTNQPVIAIDSAGSVLWARDIAPGAGAWPLYTGLSIPYVKSGDEWYFAAIGQHPLAALVFNTDSNCNRLCASNAMSFTFHDTTMFTFLPAAPITCAHFPVAAVIYAFTDSQVRAQTWLDSCDYAMPELAVKENSAAELVIYPNPANSAVHLPAAVTKAELYDMAGRLVNMQLPGAEHTIDVSNTCNGSYLLKLYLPGREPVYRPLLIMH